MLLSFRVENYRSFGLEPEEFSMLASPSVVGDERQLIALPLPGQRALRAAVILGKNGAGKSNLLRALAFLHARVQGERKRAAARRTPFALDPKARDAPTRMELRFWASPDRVLEYGLVVDDDRVREEWLARLTTLDAHETVFERVTDAQGDTTVTGPPETSAEHILAQLKPRRAEPFLTLVRRRLDRDRVSPAFEAALDWFDHCGFLWSSDEYDTHALLRAEPTRVVGEFLRRLGTGVSALDISSERVPLGSLSPRLRARLEADRLWVRHGHDWLSHSADSGQIDRDTLMAVHEGDAGPVRLPFGEESDGTRRLAALVRSQLSQARDGQGTLFVDEIDRSLHAGAVGAILRLFLAQEPKATQLVSTTHETHVLDRDLLRRDAIWFVDKDTSGASKLYALDDFPERPGLRLDDAYLDGRFGAVPPREP